MDKKFISENAKCSNEVGAAHGISKHDLFELSNAQILQKVAIDKDGNKLTLSEAENLVRVASECFKKPETQQGHLPNQSSDSNLQQQMNNDDSSETLGK